jgi:hypothetical protein
MTLGIFRSRMRLLPTDDPEWNHDPWGHDSRLRPLEIAKLAIGKDKARDLEFSQWDRFLRTSSRGMSSVLTGWTTRFPIPFTPASNMVSSTTGACQRHSGTCRVLRRTRILVWRPAAPGVQVGGLHAAGTASVPVSDVFVGGFNYSPLARTLIRGSFRSVVLHHVEFDDFAASRIATQPTSPRSPRRRSCAGA